MEILEKEVAREVEMTRTKVKAKEIYGHIICLSTLCAILVIDEKLYIWLASHVWLTGCSNSGKISESPNM